MKCKTGVVKGEALLSYSFPPPHPFTSDRAKSFWTELETEGLEGELVHPQKAEREVIELFHEREHVSYVKMASDQGYGSLDQGDTPAYRGVYEASQFVVGSTVRSVEKIMGRELVHAFNPVGGLHHANRDASAGFCVFNDVGVAIEILRKNYNIRRILYVDIDVHHGDGVFYSYESDPDLYIFDMHEDGTYLYPGTGFPSETGKGAAAGTKVNIALPPGADDGNVSKILSKLEELAEKCEPEFIIFQCGADGLAGDPIAGLNYSPRTHIMVGEILHAAAHRYSSGRLLALGGGGYKPENCARAWCAVVRVLSQS
jgi:acetoin utilization protein AcuC